MSYWAAVPHYVGQAPAPKATLALLGQLEDLVGVPIDMRGLPEEAKAWERGVDELASDDSDVAEYVRSLEEERDTADLPEASGDAIAREFERYLKRRADDS
jgi:predicted ATP-grasp superfamily ATP-dependent carboligase